MRREIEGRLYRGKRRKREKGKLDRKGKRTERGGRKGDGVGRTGMEGGILECGRIKKQGCRFLGKA